MAPGRHEEGGRWASESGRSRICVVELSAWQAVVMCGRYANARTKAQIALDFQVAEKYVEVKDKPDYNVTPQKRAPIVLTAAPPEGQTADMVRQVRLALWGLRPGFLKPEQRGFPNARVEGLAEKRSFAKPLRERRILVPMDGFYEWVRPERCMYAVSGCVRIHCVPTVLRLSGARWTDAPG